MTFNISNYFLFTGKLIIIVLLLQEEQPFSNMNNFVTVRVVQISQLYDVIHLNIVFY